MRYSDFMLDIETLGKGPRAAITQIGIVGFNLSTGEVDTPKKWNVEPHPDGVIDYDTVCWWMQQNNLARESVFRPIVQYKPAVALAQLWDYVTIYGQITPDMSPMVLSNFWAMPPNFDIVILENLYRSLHLTPPWAYNATRCLRTLCDVARVPKDQRILPAVEHDAGEDALAQAKTAILAYQRLTVTPR